MNIGAHIAIARDLHIRRHGTGHTRPEPLELLGSALPDLAAMGRFQIGRQSRSEHLDAGIDLHHRTDDAFHALPWFARRQAALTRELTRSGFNRGPALACSHVGIELLLDGVILDDPDVSRASEDAFAVIDTEHDALGDLVDADQRGPWLAHLSRFAGRPPLRNLHDPAEVAARLFRILSARPRLAFTQRQLPVLTAALGRHAPRTDETIEVIDGLVETLSTDLSLDSATF